MKNAASGHDSLVTNLRVDGFDPEEAKNNFEGALGRLMHEDDEDKAMKKEWKVYEKSVSDGTRHRRVRKRPAAESGGEEKSSKKLKSRSA